MTAAVGRGVWLLVPHGQGVDIYRRAVGTGRWLRTVLVPFKAAGLNVGGAPPSGSIYLGPRGIVTVVAGWGLTGTAAANRFFISSDDGATFTQHSAGTWFHITAVTFADARHGVTVSGPTGAQTRLYRTADGGASWSPVAMPIALTPGQQFELDTPVARGTTFQLPVTVNESDGSQHVYLYTSTNDAMTFTRPPTEALQIPAQYTAGEEPVAVLGDIVWVPARGALYESTDSGRTWTTIPATTQAGPISLIDASHAVGVVVDSGCHNGKSDCYYYSYLVATDDGGRTWHTI
jgi:hypothetical protein